MWGKKRSFRRKAVVLTAGLLACGLLVSCGRGQEAEKEESSTNDHNGQYGQNIEDIDYQEEMSVQEDNTGTEKDSVQSSAADQDEIAKRFGDGCIVEQTFEVEFSEYQGKVWFVPVRSGQGLEIKVIQGEEVLTELDSYVPGALEGEPFGSLDAVYFYDMNYDGCTDIVLIETYGDTTFAAVYYGVGAAGTDDSVYFMLQEPLSAALTERVEVPSIKEIRNYISGGRKNGEFSGYQEAYEAVAKLCDMEGTDRAYDLIYVDEDDIPELAACHRGYAVSLYSYWDGTVYTLMDDWGYGAMGNAGYAYSQRKNSVRNDNSDYAGAILYTTYMAVSNHQTLDVMTCIETLNFDDVNQNGYPDEEEMDSMGMYSVSYIDGVEVSAEEAVSYDVGGYEFIEGRMTLEELLRALRD